MTPSDGVVLKSLAQVQLEDAQIDPRIIIHHDVEATSTENNEKAGQTSNDFLYVTSHCCAIWRSPS